MSTARLVGREAEYAAKVMLRNPAAVVLTIGLPLLYLLVLGAVFGGDQVRLTGQPGLLTGSTTLVASVVVMGIVSASFQYLASHLVRDREDGVLKRLRSTPVPTGVFLAGHLVNSIVVSLLLALLVMSLGWSLYGVLLPADHLAAVLVTGLVGAMSGCALGLAVTIVVGNTVTASAVVPAITLTLFFLSGNFFNMDSAPAGLQAVANVFPIRHFYEAMLTAFNPAVPGSGVDLGHLAVVAAWGAFGLVVAVRAFRWNPSSEH